MGAPICYGRLYNRMLARLLTILFLPILILIAVPVFSQMTNQSAKPKISEAFSVRDRGNWKPLQEGIEYRRMILERSEPNYSFELKLIRIDSQSVTPRIVRSTQYRLQGADVKTLAQRSGADAAINANYFDENGRALGFLKAAAQEINRTVSQSSLFTGIFGIHNLSPFIVHRDEFQPARADEALQCGPLLLRHGKALEISRGYGRYSRRAVIGLDKEQRLLLGITAVVLGGLSWVELQELFSANEWGLQARDLLNLDGGGSAQLYIKTKTMEEFVPGTAEVPVAIGFFSNKK
jgi:exopolysaccharide biosynthesis protein